MEAARWINGTTEEAVSKTKPMPMMSTPSGVLVDAEKTITFANAAAQYNQQIVTITVPTTVRGRYLLIVKNPSTVTDLTVKIMGTRTINAVATPVFITSIVVPKQATITGTVVACYAFLLEGLFVDKGNLNLVFCNNTALGAAEGYSAYAHLLEAE